MVFNAATFNTISAIPWRSDLLVKETEVPGENHAPTCRKSPTNFFSMLYQVHLVMNGNHRTHNVNCKSNYHTVMTTTTILTIEYPYTL